MVTELITEGNIKHFLPFLSPEEYFDITNRRLSAIGLLNDEKDKAEGFLITEILPEYIRIIRLHILSGSGNAKGCAKALFSRLMDQPDDLNLPVYYITADFDSNTKYITSIKGFRETECSYGYISGKLKDMADIPSPDKKGDPVRVVSLAGVDMEKVREFILNTPHDGILQYPGTGADTGDFLEESPIYIKDGHIAAAVFLREKADFFEVSWAYSEDRSYLDHAVIKLKKMLMRDYEEDFYLRFLTCSKEDEERFRPYFSRCEIMKLHMLRFDPPKRKE